MPRNHVLCLLALLTGLGTFGLLTADTGPDSNQVLIVHDEIPQMLVLANILSEKGGFDVTLVEQNALPADWSGYRAVIGYIHRVLEVPAEMAIINYTQNGGRYIALHHSISSKKASNEFYFDFLGIRLDDPKTAKDPALPGGGYAWREEVTLTLVNLNPAHYITRHEVIWDNEVLYTSSDQPGVEGTYPAIELHESEVYLNHKYTDGRAKAVLAGLRFFDDRNGQMFMQDRAAWTKPVGNGEVVYLMAGHSATDFENSHYAQMIINAINWVP